MKKEKHTRSAAPIMVGSVAALFFTPFMGPLGLIIAGALTKVVNDNIGRELDDTFEASSDAVAQTWRDTGRFSENHLTVRISGRKVDDSGIFPFNMHTRVFDYSIGDEVARGYRQGNVLDE